MVFLPVKAHEDIDFPGAQPETWRLRLSARFRGVDDKGSAEAVRLRQRVPIMACVGGNGGGKSLCMIYTILPVLRGMAWHCENPDHLHTHGTDCAARLYLSTEPTEVCTCSTSWAVGPTGRNHVVEVAEGGTVEGFRTVLSTVALRDLDDPSKPSPFYVRLRSFVQLLAVEHADVLLDEVTGVASSRQSASLPPQVENLIQQLRRRDARLIWTTPDYGNADNRIRSVTQAVVYCAGTKKIFREREDGIIWPESRLFRWTMFDATEFDRFTAGKREKLKPMARQWFWGPGHIAREAYDTFAAVTQLGAAADGGMCLSCGGSRARPKCSCPTDPDRLPPGVVEEVTPSGIRRRRLDLVEV